VSELDDSVVVGNRVRVGLDSAERIPVDPIEERVSAEGRRGPRSSRAMEV